MGSLLTIISKVLLTISLCCKSLKYLKYYLARDLCWYNRFNKMISSSPTHAGEKAVVSIVSKGWVKQMIEDTFEYYSRTTKFFIYFFVILRTEYPIAVLKLNLLHPLTNSWSFSTSGVVEICDSNDYYPSVRAMFDINKMTQSCKLGTILFDIG